MPAIASGAYAELGLGTTTAGTEVSAWYNTDVDTIEEAELGTAHLLAVFDFFEETYGPYSFGTQVASVSANWGPGDYGGMEHHPFWHVSQGGFSNEEIHAHEAAHGWFGDGVRIECWEDFVLSEGTTSYIALHALEEVGGPVLWSEEVAWLDYMCPGYGGATPALPPTCDAIDILTDPLWSGVPYAKGACFYEDVGDLIGIEALDGVLADFYAANVNQPARMTEMIDMLKLAAPTQTAEIDALVADWLTNASCPADYAERCGSHE
jgi:aminopeptidase N